VCSALSARNWSSTLFCSGATSTRVGSGLEGVTGATGSIIDNSIANTPLSTWVPPNLPELSELIPVLAGGGDGVTAAAERDPKAITGRLAPDGLTTPEVNPSTLGEMMEEVPVGEVDRVAGGETLKGCD